MSSDFHVFLVADDRSVLVEQEGVDGKTEFASLSDATRHLRNRGGGFVVIHDDESQSANRIPLSLRG
jgi:hypothetical protein